jgi:hypothetical protein
VQGRHWKQASRACSKTQKRFIPQRKLFARKVSGLTFGGRGVDEFGILSCQPGTHGLSSLPVSQDPEHAPHHRSRLRGLLL